MLPNKISFRTPAEASSPLLEGLNIMGLPNEDATLTSIICSILPLLWEAIIVSVYDLKWERKKKFIYRNIYNVSSRNLSAYNRNFDVDLILISFIKEVTIRITWDSNQMILRLYRSWHRFTNPQFFYRSVYLFLAFSGLKSSIAFSKSWGGSKMHFTASLK